MVTFCFLYIVNRIKPRFESAKFVFPLERAKDFERWDKIIADPPMVVLVARDKPQSNN